MNTFEVVMLKSDTNLIPVKYSVVEVTIGNSLATSYAWLKFASHGVTDQTNLDLYYSTYDPTKLTGTTGEYLIKTLSEISPYSRKVNVKGEVPHSLG